jgi:hypothetical protein
MNSSFLPVGLQIRKMSRAHYIDRTCRNNDLLDTVVKYAEFDGTPVYIDRHVGVPRGSRIWACEAGLALLNKWHRQIAIMQKGVSFNGPILIVDESWLNGRASAPPPHVMIFAKRSREPWSYHLDANLTGVTVEAPECPFGDLVLEHIGPTQLEYSPARDWETEAGGLWKVPPVPSRIVDRRFVPLALP